MGKGMIVWDKAYLVAILWKKVVNLAIYSPKMKSTQMVLPKIQKWLWKKRLGKREIEAA